ncbi:MAG TPA: hypothetical protein VL400_23060 [Polyangiaceae bacterium]|jgi:hypothetical protein|nr:hypothetical protein [Polyangiaceae bacterium]
MALAFLLEKLFPKAPPPLLLRAQIMSDRSGHFVVADGIVRIDATTDDGVRTTLSPRSAQGLVLVPWLGGARLDLVLRKGDARGAVEITLEEARAGRVIDVPLEPA